MDILDVRWIRGSSASTFAIGMWALGRWLRSKGYGPQLDRLDRQYTALQLQSKPARPCRLPTACFPGAGSESPTCC